MSNNNNKENNINHKIMNEDVIDREELVEYLTWILEHDGELERFYDRELLREDEDDSVPDVRGFRDWLKEQTFDNMIRESYFEDYIKQLYEDMGEYVPDSYLHRHIDWERVCEGILDNDYYGVFDEREDDPFNIFGEQFHYHI